MATQRMVDRYGTQFDIPQELVQQASGDGLFTLSGPAGAPGHIGSGLPLSTMDRVLSSTPEDHPYMNALANSSNQLVSGTAVGAGKALGRHLVGAANVARQGINYATGSTGSIPTPNFLQPSNPGEQVGGVMEGIGEFMAPEAWAGDAAKAGSLAKAAYTGATQGLVQSIQQGQVNRSSAVAAGLGVVSSLGGDALVAAGKKYLPKMFNKGLVPSRADLASGANPGQAVMDEGIVGGNFQTIADQADQLRSQVGKRIDATLQTAPNLAKRVDLQPSIDQVDNLTDIARQQNRPGVADEFANMRQRFTHDATPIPNDPTRTMMVPRAPSTTSLTQVSPFAANNIKRGLNDFTTWGSSPSAMEAGNQMMTGVYGGVNDAVTRAVPEVADLNARYQNLRALATSAGRRAEFVDRSGRSMLGPVLGSQIGMISGAGAGYRTHGIPGAVAGGVVGGIAGSLGGGAVVSNPGVLSHAMAAVPYVNPFLNTMRAGALSMYNNFNPSDVHGTNQ